MNGGCATASQHEALLPHNIEAEVGVLGGLLIDTDAIAQVVDFLQPEDFYREAHRSIYEAASDLHASHAPTDLIALCDELQRRGKLDDVGGGSYVSSLANQVPTSANVVYYGRIVERSSILRRLIDASAHIAGVAYSNSDVEKALDEAEMAIADIRERHARSATAKEPRFRLLSDDEIMNLEPAAGIVGNILFEDTIAFLYAREGRWKTFLALDWAMCCASGRMWHGRPVTGGPVVYIAAEGAHGIGKRIAAWKTHHEVHEPTAIQVLGRPVQLMDAGEVRQLVADIRTQTHDGDPVLVVIDTLARSMIGGDENSARDINAVTAAAYAIKEAFGCCVLVVHHAGKDDARGLRGSSALRSNADTVIRVASAKENEPSIAPGEPITVKCEKTKDEAPFADITLTAQTVTVARENGVTFDSLVLAPADLATARNAAPKLTANQQKALDTLYRAMPDGLTSTKWHEATRLARSTFYDARDLLQDRTFIDRWAKTYVVSRNGEEHVSESLRLKSDMLDRTPKGATRSPKDVNEAEITNPEFMGIDAGPNVRRTIGGSDIRTNQESASGSDSTDDDLVCKVTGSSHIYAMQRTADGRHVCTECQKPAARVGA